MSLTIPDALDLNDRDIAMLLASTLYEKGKLSLGQAAQLANLSKRTFAELLGKYDVSIFNDGANNLLRDVQNSWGHYIRYQKLNPPISEYPPNLKPKFSDLPVKLMTKHSSINLYANIYFNWSETRMSRRKSLRR